MQGGEDQKTVDEAKVELHRWIWWSSPESVRAGVPSITAIIETIAAVILYWWAAWNWATYWPLILSAAIAPLVLLRSDKSVALGLKWFAQFENNLNHQGSEGWRKWLMAGFALPLATIFNYFISSFLAQVYLMDLTSWSAFILSFGIGLLAIILAGILAGTASIAVKGTIEKALDVASVGAIAGTLAVVGAVTVEGVGVGAIAGAVAVAIVAAVARANKKYIGKIIATTFRFLLLPSFAFGFAAGVFIVSLAVRIGATLHYLHYGIRVLPKNFRRLVVSTSPRHIPELVPCVPRGSDFSLSYWAEDLNNAPHLFQKILPLTLISVWFFPGWLYRITLKSTAWLWWPLAFLINEVPEHLTPERHRRNIAKSFSGWVTIIMAIVVIGSFLASHLLLPMLQGAENPLIHTLGLMLIIDWGNVPPWQLLNVFSAALSLLILYFVDRVMHDYADALEDKSKSRRIKTLCFHNTLVHLSKLRWLFFIGFMTLVGFHSVLDFNRKSCWFTPPPHVQTWSKYFYGDRAPLPPECSQLTPAVE